MSWAYRQPVTPVEGQADEDTIGVADADGPGVTALDGVAELAGAVLGAVGGTQGLRETGERPGRGAKSAWAGRAMSVTAAAAARRPAAAVTTCFVLIVMC